MEKQKLVIGISGASGAIYGIRLLEALQDIKTIESHLILSKGAEDTIKLETDFEPLDVLAMADHNWEEKDFTAPISSGSHPVMGMIILPCSMKTLSAIANCYDDNLISRAAGVQLKERRKLVIAPRESPLHLGHLRNMTAATEMGAIIVPPVPAFYHHPKTIDDIVNQTVGKILDQFSISHDLFKRWGAK
ncbi:MAG: UbiX family flavin prenyltransferase [SAR324 cluster bacterium]|nr:UbiX family flavin prenyltransferase [SAR324 cluster bacterium]